jgi:hypothetical protein
MELAILAVLTHRDLSIDTLSEVLVVAFLVSQFPPVLSALVSKPVTPTFVPRSLRLILLRFES